MYIFCILYNHETKPWWPNGLGCQSIASNNAWGQGFELGLFCFFFQADFSGLIKNVEVVSSAYARNLNFQNLCEVNVLGRHAL